MSYATFVGLWYNRRRAMAIMARPLVTALRVALRDDVDFDLADTYATFEEDTPILVEQWRMEQDVSRRMAESQRREWDRP
jgi:hypothetical protein